MGRHAFLDIVVEYNLEELEHGEAAIVGAAGRCRRHRRCRRSSPPTRDGHACNAAKHVGPGNLL